MESNKKNWFARILIIILSLFIAVLITISFIFSEQKFIITSGIIASVALLIVLVLSEVFDSLSVGNILNLKRKIKETTEDLDKSKKENETLRNQLIAQDECECFLEIKSQLLRYSPSIFMIYYMLNKIYFYRTAANKKAKLILIVPIMDKELLKNINHFAGSESDFEAIRNMFMPAINNNLLEIRPIHIDKTIYEEIILQK